MDRRMLEYLPRILRDVWEVLAYTDGQQWAFDQAWLSAERVMANQFILDADDYGLSRWERMLKIIPKADDTLEIRRNRILLRLREKLPFTLRMLRKQLKLLCGEGKYTAEIPRATYLLTVMIDLSAQAYLDDVMDLLLRMVPANLLFKLYVLAVADPVTADWKLIPVEQGGYSRTELEERDIPYHFQGKETVAAVPSPKGAYTVTLLPRMEIEPVFGGRWGTGGGIESYSVTRLEKKRT